MASAAAKRESHHIIGQVIDHLAPNALSVLDLDTKGIHRVVTVSADDFPVGVVVECTMNDQNGVIEHLQRVSDQTLEKYRHKIFIQEW